VHADEQEVVEHPLAEFGESYVRRLTSAGPDTQSRYLRQVAALSRWLADVKGSEPTVENVTADDDADWVNARRRAGTSPKTIANYHGLLFAIFKSAVGKELITRNPCEGTRLPPVDDDTEDDEEKVFLTEPEFALVRECMHADSRDLITVAVGTGLRWGELTALKVKDLSLDASDATLKVRRAWKRNGRGEFAVIDAGRFYLGTPKTKESRRRVTLAPTIVEALRGAIAGKGPDDLLFGSPRGHRLDQANWYESRWQRAVAAAQEQGLAKSPRFHDLRHSHVISPALAA
jgi:integrase